MLLGYNLVYEIKSFISSPVVIYSLLLQKVDQISGIRDREGSAVKPEEIYEEFVRLLPTILPSEYVDQAVKQSYDSEADVKDNESHSTQQNMSFNRHRQKKLNQNETNHVSNVFDMTAKCTIVDDSNRSFCFNFS